MPKRSTRKTTGPATTISDPEAVENFATGRPASGRIMYIECKEGGIEGDGRIGRVTFSKTGRTLYYDGRSFQSLKGTGFKANYFCLETGEEYWISGPKRNGCDRLYGGGGVPIDEGVREEYWTSIRRRPGRIGELTT